MQTLTIAIQTAYNFHPLFRDQTGLNYGILREMASPIGTTHIHTDQALGARLSRSHSDEAWKHEIITDINKRLTDTVEDIMFVAECLATIFPDRLPVKKWLDWGIKLRIEPARDLKRMAHCPDFCDRANWDCFPHSQDMMRELFQLWEHGKDNGAFFRECIAKGLIRPGMPRSDIRDLKTLGQTRAQALEQRRRAAMGDPDCQSGQNIFTGHMSQLHNLIKNNSADMFFTDPQYQENSIDQFGELATLASEKLRPGGLLLTYTGQYYLPDVMDQLGTHLTWFWMFCIRFPHIKPPIWSHNIANCWRPLLVFVKPPMTKLSQMVMDLRDGNQDKNHHDWGQGLSEALYYIEQLTKPGDLVVEPFCGGGTTPAACKHLGRRCISTEIDPATAAVARHRLLKID